jgi:hypothetical protein
MYIHELHPGDAIAKKIQIEALYFFYFFYFTRLDPEYV